MGKPHFLTDPANSQFDVLHYDEFTKLEDSEVQIRFSKKNLVVRGWPRQDPLVETKFDTKGLCKLAGSLSRQVSLHGLLPEFPLFLRAGY